MGDPAPRFRCLELLPVRWRTTEFQESCECAVLHEIWANGGLFQLDRALTPGAPVRIVLPHGEVTGVVLSCIPEARGFILEVNVSAAQEWLGGRYAPSDLMPLSGGCDERLP